MKKAVAMLSIAAWAGVVAAGTCTYSFAWFKNSAVTDFQVPLTLREGMNGFSYAEFADAAGGTDLRVTDTNGTLLPYEIESWNPSGVSIVWVKVPAFSNETTLTLSWGDAGAAQADAMGGADFWSGAFTVMHFGDTPGKNSVNGDVLSKNGTGTIASGIGPLGTALSLDRSATYKAENLDATTYGIGTTAFTFSFWLRTDRLTRANDQTYLVQWGQRNATGYSQCAVLLNWDGNAAFRLYWNTGASTGSWDVGNTAMAAPQDGLWHHVAFTYDGSAFTYYLDGKISYTKNFSGFSINAWNNWGYLTVGSSRSGSNALHGLLDELRLERVCRSAEWLRAAVETQSQTVPGRTAIIQFSDYEGSEPLIDFPAYIHLDENAGINPGAFYAALTNGTARIIDYRTGTLLPLDVEYAASNAFDNAFGIWVRMPRYSRTDGVVLAAAPVHYVPADTTAATLANTLDPKLVWNPDAFRLVYHMNPTGYLNDVVNDIRLTPYYNRASTYGGTAYPKPTAGPTGPYQAYQSSTNSAQVNESVTIAAPLTNVWTVSWWMKEEDEEFANPKAHTYIWSIFGVSALKGAGSDWVNYGVTGNGIALHSGGTAEKLTVPDACWHHYAYAADGKNTYCYRDGELQLTASHVMNFNCPTSISGKKVMLTSSSATLTDAFIGRADEIRLEAVCRSADWIRACWRNQLAWRDGTPWQFAPHFAADVSDTVSAAGTLTASASLVCRTNATVTFCWGRTDAGKSSMWENSVALGTKADGEVSATAIIPVQGARYAYRFRAENEYGTAWTHVNYVTVPVTRADNWSAKIAVAYDGAETLTNFPLCVRIPAANRLPADSGRVRFVDDEGRILAWEAEQWNPAATSVVWVVVPRLSPASALTMRFGADFEDDGDWSADCVWVPKEYAGVWHFAPPKSSSSGNYTDDSTSFGAHIRTNTLRAHATNGVAGTAFNWPRNGNGQTLSDNNGTPFNDFKAGFTFSFWAKIPNEETPTKQMFIKHELRDTAGLASGLYHMYVVRYNQAANGIVDLYPYTLNKTLFPQGLERTVYLRPEHGGASSTAASDMFLKICQVAKPDEGWHHYTFTHDGFYLASYLDGVRQNRAFWPFCLNAAVLGRVRMRTAFGSNTGADELALGSLDEYRAERVGRSEAWIKACYDNQKPGSTFVTVGRPYFPGTLIILQ